MPLFVIDTSSLIEGWVRAYPPENFPTFWELMDDLVRRGELITPTEVFEELESKDDDLHAWVKDRADVMVQPTTRPLMAEVRNVLAAHPHLTKTGTGRNRADPFVIALGSIRSLPIVTQEKGGSAKKPRIPYVCEKWGVGNMNILGMVKALSWRI